MSLSRTTSGNRGSLFFCIILKSSLTIDWLLARCDSDLRCVTADPVLLIKKKAPSGETVCSAVAKPIAELSATVAWQLSRASGELIRTDTGARTGIQTFQHFRVLKSTNIFTVTQKKCQTFNREEAAFQPRLAPPAAPLCRGGTKRRIVIRLPPFRRTHFPFSSLFLIHQVFSQTTPSSSAELGFLQTLALRAAVYDAELMYIQHLL